MQFKTVFSTSFLGLLATALLIVFSLPVSADSNTGNPKTEKVIVNKDSDYWFDKGALCATYGNDKAAIKYFQKAIAKDPQRSGAYFAQGISYGQLGNYFKAVELINKALELSPDNGMYYYGRGRVYLLAGEKQKAMQDFQKAAALGDEDAQIYIDQLAGTQ